MYAGSVVYCMRNVEACVREAARGKRPSTLIRSGALVSCGECCGIISLCWSVSSLKRR